MEIMSGRAILKISFFTGIVPILFCCGLVWADMETSENVFFAQIIDINYSILL